MVTFEEIKNTTAYLCRLVKPIRKYKSEFVKKQQALQARTKDKIVWLSKPNIMKPGITYIKKQHGHI